MSDSLFDTADLSVKAPRPLADILRPKTLAEIAGQDQLLGPQGTLTRMLESGHVSSLILWGPPGCGKTTLARILADQVDLHFDQISAIFSGVGDLKKVFEAAKLRRQNGRGTLLFVDEIHRFNKSQQDAFLPVVEDGTITLIGATTENPSFELNAALLSRTQVLILRRLDDPALELLLERAEKQVGRTLPVDDTARDLLKTMADGDGRYLLTMAEQVFSAQNISNMPSPRRRGSADTDAKRLPLSREMQNLLSSEDLIALLQKRAPLYDKSDEGHYNLISALHKSVRGSDVDAALYWLARMLEGGEDPKFLARRITRMAVEDIGLADPQAMTVCLSAWQVYERLGSPEGELALVQALIYVATAPKSNAAYVAYKSARQSAKETGSLMPPAHILNAPTSLMKEIGYGKGYAYDHDVEDGFSGQNYFPEDMKRTAFYQPVERGFERDIQKRLAYWQKLRLQKNKSNSA